MPKILLVEDNEMNRDMLSRRLQRKGYQVVLALDGQSGVEMTCTQVPDLVLMDMSLPVLDGWAFMRIVRERGLNLTVVVMTAMDRLDRRLPLRKLLFGLRHLGDVSSGILER